MIPRNTLIQIAFRSNRFLAFTRMTAFLVNCKLFSRNISRWCSDVITLVTRLISVLVFFPVGCVGEARYKYWFDGTAEMPLIDGWTLEPLFNHWRKFGLLMVAAPLAVLPGVWLYPWLFGVQNIFSLINASFVHEGIEVLSFDHWQLHGRVRGSSKICNSVDNNLLPKIRFRQKFVTFSSGDVNRKCWPKSRLLNWYGNTNRWIRKNGVADHTFTEF